MMSLSMLTLPGDYLSLESYRKNGEAIRTPVWFAEANGSIYIYTLTRTPKVARVRNNPNVRIAECDFKGKVKADWIDARATIVQGKEDAFGHSVLRKKYKWQKAFGDLMNRFLKRQRTVIRLDSR